MSRYSSDRQPAAPWTEEEKTRLKYLMTQNHTTAQIGRMMGRTKGSVIGQTHRLGLTRPRKSIEHHETL